MCSTLCYNLVTSEATAVLTQICGLATGIMAHGANASYQSTHTQCRSMLVRVQKANLSYSITPLCIGLVHTRN